MFIFSFFSSSSSWHRYKEHIIDTITLIGLVGCVYNTISIDRHIGNIQWKEESFSRPNHLIKKCYLNQKKRKNIMKIFWMENVNYEPRQSQHRYLNIVNIIFYNIIASNIEHSIVLDLVIKILLLWLLFVICLDGWLVVLDGPAVVFTKTMAIFVIINGSLVNSAIVNIPC